MNHEKYRSNRRSPTAILAPSGLLGLAVVTLVQLLQVEEPLDVSLTVSVYCFAISIPILALRVMAKTRESQFEYLVKIWWVEGTLYVGLLASFVGFVAVFFHFSYIVGALFLCFGIAAVVVDLVYSNILVAINEQETSEAAGDTRGNLQQNNNVRR